MPSLADQNFTRIVSISGSIQLVEGTYSGGSSSRHRRSFQLLQLCPWDWGCLSSWNDRTQARVLFSAEADAWKCFKNLSDKGYDVAIMSGGDCKSGRLSTR